MAATFGIGDNRGISGVRALVVEDFEPFRRFIRSMLGRNPELYVIAEVSDGIEAVRKAEELQPNLILLDIGLPRLTGIEAARRIRQLSPESKIIFLTQESSADIVQEAISSGAWGYVMKARAASDLLPAIQAVREGQRFVSEGLLGQHLADARLHPEEDPTSPAPSSSFLATK
jgi:DNA-binding NarL/FixJ family response regulator